MPARRVSSSVKLPPFQKLFDAHGLDVHRFLVATVGREDAEDCYQETWLAALRAYPRLRDASNLRSWILTVAHHKAIDHVRTRRRQAIPVAEVPERVHNGGSGASGGPGGAAVSVAGGSSGGAAVPGAGASFDGQSEIWDRVRALPPKQRTALALRFVADAAYAEISTVMGTSEDAARRNVHEGLKRLRMEYER
jgi:RNA polymerase sigma factor (sigma-70 family)